MSCVLSFPTILTYLIPYVEGISSPRKYLYNTALIHSLQLPYRQPFEENYDYAKLDTMHPGTHLFTFRANQKHIMMSV